MSLDLSSLKKAILSLDALLRRIEDRDFFDALDETIRNGLKAGVIQNFEFTYELCWKFMKRDLEINIGSTYVDGVNRKELFRIGAENHLIVDVTKWIQYHELRNITSHTYEAEKADAVFSGAFRFIDDAKGLLAALERRND